MLLFLRKWLYCVNKTDEEVDIIKAKTNLKTRFFSHCEG